MRIVLAFVGDGAEGTNEVAEVSVIEAGDHVWSCSCTHGCVLTAINVIQKRLGTNGCIVVAVIVIERLKSSGCVITAGAVKQRAGTGSRILVPTSIVKKRIPSDGRCYRRRY